MSEPPNPAERPEQILPLAASPASTGSGRAAAPTIPEQYESLLAKLGRAERELETDGAFGRSGSLEEASGIVFDLLYSLDYKSGGELVPRLAGLYGYIANEILSVGKTRDRVQLAHLRDMITALRQSWYEGQNAA